LKKLKIGIIGLGFIGSVHIDAINRSPFAEVAAICDANREFADLAGKTFQIPKVYYDYHDIISDPEIQVIHNCTPNNLHFEINRLALENEKHILCEKPLGMTSEETAALLEISKAHPSLKTCVDFNYRMYPLIQEYKKRMQENELGTPRLVHGHFLQDWLLYDTDYSWRLENKVAGKTRAVGDIGSHWCDIAETLLGTRIKEVMANLVTVIPTRKKPLKQVKTFSSSADDGQQYENFTVSTEDYACVMLKMENGVQGIFYISQVSAGHKCDLNIEINTDKLSWSWSQQESDRAWLGYRDQANQTEMRNPNSFHFANQYTHLPSGHPEGFHDAILNNFNAFYQSILIPGNTDTDYATFEDGHHIMSVIDAIVASSQTKRWVTVTD
jgi:predicted dehydrogenase